MRYRFIVSLLMLFSGLLLTACDNASDSTDTLPPTESADTTEVAESTSSQTEENQSTPATEEATEAVVTEAVIPSNNEDYFLAISYTVDAASAPEDTPPVPEGSEWVIVVASLGSQGGESVEVGVGDLTLIDTGGNRHIPDAPDSATEPPLIGATVEEGASLRGLVRFAIPQGITPAFLEWCPGGDCDQRLQTPFP